MPDRLYRLGRFALTRLPPEFAHRLTIRALARGIVPAPAPEAEAADLGITLFGYAFPNPFGLAAGFDKNAEVPDEMLKLGFGFVEVGTVTPRPQAGNPRPRVFRLKEDRAIINRLGFPSEGLVAVKPRLERRWGGSGIVGANIGANKDSYDRLMDYDICLRTLYGYADYFAINVSSPNTPGLRGLQGKRELDDLLSMLVATRTELHRGAGRPTPLLLKIAPDLGQPGLEDVAAVVEAHRLDGVIVSNTTIEERGDLRSANRVQAGGLSGPPLFRRSTQMLAELYRLTGGRVPLIGVGGISSGREAYLKIRMGASLVQLYTALVYRGPEVIGIFKRELVTYLKADGFTRLAEAVGTGADGTHKALLRSLAG
ncbi:MAG: quinone-dependent dihydroorotate dehydrogenase [Alphaproteobacteria bacterium]|nr:quinone-dependent dihydroorotate dehydrogenase [Alphaproteobacteria bacterium]